jgi:hypothetical protein
MPVFLEYAGLIVGCSIANRARGSQVFGLVNSTVAGRLIATATIAVITSLVVIPDATLMAKLFILTFAGLMLWATPAWDAYWSAEIGNDPNHSKLWGIMMMGWRQLLIVPTFVGQAFLLGHPERAVWAGTALLYWLPYFAYGAVAKPVAVELSEYTIGAMIGFTIMMIARGF